MIVHMGNGLPGRRTFVEQQIVPFGFGGYQERPSQSRNGFCHFGGQRRRHFAEPLVMISGHKKQMHFDHPAAEARFAREIHVTARLQHPNIIPVYDAGRWPTGEAFYSMKLVDGESLSDVILKCKDFEGRLALVPTVLGAAEAIAYAHSQKIIHRDLKPAG